MIPSPILSIRNGNYTHYIYDEPLDADAGDDVEEGSFHSYIFNIENKSFCPYISCGECPYNSSDGSCISNISTFLASHLSHLYPEAFI